MPVTPTYPGVYIQEVDSGSRVVTGVATSITAFVGRTPSGPVNEPVMVYDFGEFQRTFGGRARKHPMTYAVEDFFGNGGGQALIVRAASANAKIAALGGATPVQKPADQAADQQKPADQTPDQQKAAETDKQAAAAAIAIHASSPGAWGNAVQIKFEKVTGQSAKDIAARFSEFNLGVDAFYFLTVAYPVQTGQTPTPAEKLGPLYVGATDAPCRIDHVLAAQSLFVRADAPAGAVTAPTADTYQALSGGDDGGALTSKDLLGDESLRTGMYALDHTDLFNILVIPPDAGPDTSDDDLLAVLAGAAPYCDKRRAILIAEPLSAWGDAAKKSAFDKISPADLNIGELGQRRRVFAYFPRIKKLDPENGNREMVFSASGMIAGIFAATDVRRGVWKAPAGIEAGLSGVTALEYRLTDMQNGVLNQVGVNVLRDFPVIGKVIWGSRTLAGADALSDDYKYLPVRRLTDYIEESLFRGTKFAVFEPNAETLWAQLRLTVDTFMADLNRQGAFYNYYVRCDKSTTTAYDIDRGRVNVIVAFAPVKPAEFVILTIQQLAGQTAA